MIVDRYYYTQLSEEERKIYTIFYKGVTALEKEIFLPGVKLDQQMIHRIFRAITADNPHLYYFNQSCMNLGRTQFGDVLLPQYFCNKDQIDTYNGRVSECVSNIVYQLDLMNASEEEKLKRVHDYMAKNIVYDHEALQVSKVDRLVAAHSIIGFFAKQRAVCEGIAKAAKLLLNTVDMKCIYVMGKSSLEKHGEHGWNIVKVNGRPYHIDFTWDVANSKNGIINYDYYNLPEAAILLDHSDFTGVPQCTSWDDNYFVKENMFFDSMKELEAELMQRIKQGQRMFYFKMSKNAGYTMKEIVQSAASFAVAEVSQDETIWKSSSSLNEEQRTGRIILIKSSE